MNAAAAAILLISLIMLVSIVSTMLSPRLGLPVLLMFLVLGMLAGEDGLLGINYNDVFTSYLIGSAALAVILFDGGLRTDPRGFRVGLRPALSMATVGVLISAGLTGVAAHFALGIGWLEAALVGAIVGSTDAAAVFSLLRGQNLALQGRVSATLEIESGANDPMAVFLTIIFVQAVALGTAPGFDTLGFFLWQFGLGTAAGVLAGIALAWCLTHLKLNAGLYPLMVLFGALLLFGAVALVEGSGFLAVYVAGLVLARRIRRGLFNLENFLDGTAWLAQIVMFLMLGLLVTPTALLATAVGALLVGLALIFIARPVAVLICLAPFRFSWRERLFVSWVGLRGAVPIILALFPWIAGLPNHQLYFNVAFFVVLLSLLLQGWTIAPVARLLGLEVPSRGGRVKRVELGIPGQEEFELVGYEVGADSSLSVRPLSDIAWPGISRPLVAIRGRQVLWADALERLLPGDQIYVFARLDELQELDRIVIGAGESERVGERRFFGEFVISPDAPLGALASVYGVDVAAAAGERSIGSLLLEHHPMPVVGDRLMLGGLVLTVREMRDDRIHEVGLKLPEASGSGSLRRPAS